MIGTALIENAGELLTADDVDYAVARHKNFAYQDVIAETFRDIYYTDEENMWLDIVTQNIARMPNLYKKAIAYYALFQACIIKRPYNLFHRQNLYMRTADVERGFGNKTTWDRPFEEHFRNFADIANDAVFDSGVPCKAMCRDALDVPGTYDLVYIDTPYINGKGVGVDYLDFYHFLEGLLHYPTWRDSIDYCKKHRPFKGTKSPWSDRRSAHDAFEKLFRRYADSILVVSYRNDGIPARHELIEMMSSVKHDVRIAYYDTYKYALSTNDSSREILLIGV